MLPYVFFDSGSAVIPGRYVLLQSAQEVGAFTETELLQVLEIINTLSYTKDCIPSVLDLLKEEGEETENLQETNEDLKAKADHF